MRRRIAPQAHIQQSLPGKQIQPCQQVNRARTKVRSNEEMPRTYRASPSGCSPSSSLPNPRRRFPTCQQEPSCIKLRRWGARPHLAALLGADRSRMAENSLVARGYNEDDLFQHFLQRPCKDVSSVLLGLLGFGSFTRFLSFSLFFWGGGHVASSQTMNAQDGQGRPLN